MGDGDDIIAELAEVNGIAQTCFSGRAKGKFLFFFKVHHPSTEKQKALVGFNPRKEPELGTGDSHSTSTPPLPSTLLQVFLILV